MAHSPPTNCRRALPDDMPWPAHHHHGHHAHAHLHANPHTHVHCHDAPAPTPSLDFLLEKFRNRGDWTKSERGPAPRAAEPRDSDALVIRGGQASPERIAAIAAGLRTDRRTTKVIVEGSVGEHYLLELFDALRSNGSVVSLEIRGTKLGSEVFASLVALLMSNRILECLSLEWNHLGTHHQIMHLLADSLIRNETLRILDLKNNLLADDAVHALVVGLRANRGLRRLDLRWNRIASHGANLLLDLLHHNRNLREIELSGNDVPASVLEDIRMHLSGNPPRSPAHRESDRVPALTETFECLRTANEEAMSCVASQLQRADEERKSLGHWLAIVESDLARTSEDAANWEERAKNAEMERESYERGLESLHEETGMLLKRLEEQLDIESKKNRGLTESAQNAAKEYKTKLGMLEQGLREASARLRNSERTSRDLAEELERERAKMLNAEQAFNGKLASVEHQHQKRMNKLEASRRENEEQLRREHEHQTMTLKQTKEALQLELDRMKEAQQRSAFMHQEQLQSAMSAKADLAAQVIDLNSELQDSKRDSERLESENGRIKSEVKRLQDACDELSLNLANSTTQREQLERSEKAWQRTKRDLEEVISKLKENLENRGKQIEQLTGDAQDAERRIEQAMAVLTAQSAAHRRGPTGLRGLAQ